MELYLDNKNIKSFFSIHVLDPTPMLGISGERENNRVWADKSGVDKNRVNKRLSTHTFTLECLCNATTALGAHEIVTALCDYFFEKGCVVLSMRDGTDRFCCLVERMQAIDSNINVQSKKSLYVFSLELRDVNPNAIKYYTNVGVGLNTEIEYTKGVPADVYLGDGRSSIVSNSGNYVYSDYASEGLVEIIIDTDRSSIDVDILVADFSADKTTGITPEEIMFTPITQGDVLLYSWDFGDGNASQEQSPKHTYTREGVFTVTLQVFNNVQGYVTVTKTNHITIRRSRLLLNNENFFKINTNNYLLKN